MKRTFFPHLHIHDDHSMRDGCAIVETYADEVVKMKGHCLAITNHGMAAGFARQYFACRERDIKPIFGMEAYVNEDRLKPWPRLVTSLRDKAKKKMPLAAERLARAEAKVKDQFRPSRHAIILAKNRAGYRNLVKMSTDSWINGYYYVPRTDTRFLEEHAQGLIFSTACIGGYIPVMARHDFGAAVEESKRLQRIFDGEFYVEIMMTEYFPQQETNMMMLQIAEEIRAPVIVTCDVHYHRQSDSLAQDVMLLMRDKKTIKDREAGEGVWQFEAKDLWWRSLEDVARCWKENHSHYMDRETFLRAIRNTYALAESIEDIEFDTSLKLPGVFQNPEPTLKEMVRSGLRRRKDDGEIPCSGRSMRDYVDRAKRELDVIIGKGFSEYFLILADICQAARDMGALMGPGRGSAGGSLVAFLCRITEVDPLRFNLLFERFLDENRPDPPDIDLDFSPQHRDGIKAYIQERYPATATIGSFATFKPRAILRDVGRVFGVDHREMLDVTNGMGTEGDGKSWEEIFELWPHVEAWSKKYPEAFGVAEVLKGLISHRGKNAAGVLIAPADALDELPLMVDPADKSPVTAYTDRQADGVTSDGREITRLGYLKMDILGLMNVNIPARANEMLRRDTGASIDLDHVPLDDPEALAIASTGDVPGVFQLDSPVAGPILRTIKVDAFSDLVMATALGRPGPLKHDIHKLFGKLKMMGEAWKEGLQPELIEVLQDSRGLMILQEDIMHVVQILGGLTFTEANKVRKVVGKKLDPEVLRPWEEKFMKGGKERGHDEEGLNETWSKIVAFAKYGFNKSHSVAYMLTAYRQLFMMAHHPLYYFAALLEETQRDKKTTRGDQRLAVYMRAAMARGFQVMGPSVSSGGPSFDVIPESGRIRFGYEKIKGVGSAAPFIGEAQPFKTFEEFFERVNKRKVNKTKMKALILAGAFDDMPFEPVDDEDWEEEIEVRNALLRCYHRIKKEKGEAEVFLPLSLYDKERDLLGLALSWWGSNAKETLRESQGLSTIAEAHEMDRSRFHLLVEVTRAREIDSRSGKMAFLSVCDETDSLSNIVIWASQWKKWGRRLKEGQIAVIRLRREEAQNDRYGRWAYKLDHRHRGEPVESAMALLRRMKA